MTTSVAQDARSALITAAERLFAERGVNGVSLREVTRAAGQRNTTALQYHFTDRAGLVRALLVKHGQDVGARRNVLLDQYELTGRADLRALASALILPLIAKLADPDGGRGYLQIAAELLNVTNRMIEPGTPVAAILMEDPGGSMPRWLDLVAPLLPAEAIGPPLHRRFAAMHFAYVELSRRAKDEPGDQQLFTLYLTDLVTAVLAAPVSEETRAFLAKRRR